MPSNAPRDRHDKKRLSVVVPVYNGSQSLPELRDRLNEVLAEIADDYEIVLVDDNSRDNSWQTICQLAAEDSRIRGIRLSRNFGQHNALLCGIKATRYEMIVTMDDDLQHPPEEIPRLLSKLEEGFDVVYGTPTREQHSLFRNLASQLTKMTLQGAMGVETARNVCAFRVFRAWLSKGFDNYRSSYVSIDVLLTWGTTRFAAIPVEHAPRRIGTSNYTIGKLIAHAFNMMTGFTTIPLHVASVLGFTFTLFGAAILVWVVARYLIYGATVPGFAFLASAIAIFSGVQLFALGIIGEYMARIHFRTMGRPPFIVKQETAGPEAQITQQGS